MLCLHWLTPCLPNLPRNSIYDSGKTITYCERSPSYACRSSTSCKFFLFGILLSYISFLSCWTLFCWDYSLGLELDAKNRSGLAGLWGYVTYSNNLVNNFYLLIKHSLTYGTLKYQILIEYNVFLLQNMYAQLLPLALPIVVLLIGDCCHRQQ